VSDDGVPVLRARRARDFATYLRTATEYPYATMISVEAEGPYDAVIIDVEPELPQRRVVDIRDHERIRIEFDLEDADVPRAFAEREDFPLGLVHTNYSSRDMRCWLCLWEESWSEAKARLDPETLLIRLRTWLERTARGENHGDGQPLEPLLQNTSSTLIVPPGGTGGGEPLVTTGIDQSGGVKVVRLGVSTGAPAPYRISIFEVDAPSSVQRAFALMPRTLAALDAIAESLGAGFMQRLCDWLRTPELDSSASVLIVLKLRTAASADNGAEEVDVRAFAPGLNVGELGVALGVMFDGVDGGKPAPRLQAGACVPDSVGIEPWRVIQRLDRAAARTLSGSPGAGDRRILVIGAGAIGSNIIDAAARTGSATWTIVDDDVVFPHNTVRQAQGDADVGAAKAISLAKLVNARLAEPLATAIVANVLEPGGQAEALHQAAKSADLVVDLTASPVALRAITAMHGVRRAASLFFGPDGSDLVLLAEDGERTIRLDEIEAQYFWASARLPDLEGHLDSGRLDFVRYANACQDLTRPLPPWKVLTLSAIAARQLELLGTTALASITVWRLNDASAEIERVDVPVAAPRRAELGEWQVSVSNHAEETMDLLRRAALPSETGGVLLGVVDLYRRTVHVTGVLPAPADSEHAPAYFVRGAAELRTDVEEIIRRSAGVLSYVGEWHSHPRRAETRPSDDDETLFAKLHERVGPTAKPYCMAIIGDAGLWMRIAASSEVAGEVTWERKRLPTSQYVDPG
jgi:hypothetical protein